MKKYEEFIVYDLENTGDRTELNITSEELRNHLNPKKVLIIISNHLKRIYIWKGAKSHVRKKFISSRIAQELQRKLIQDPMYNRCKIISIDQGRELQEFINAFRLESMEATDTLPDMRYPRNFERDKRDFKFLDEKLNNYLDTVERMMAVILRISDLVDQSLATVNQKLSTLESRINGTSTQKSTTIPKDGDQPTSPSSGGSRGVHPAGPVNLKGAILGELAQQSIGLLIDNLISNIQKNPSKKMIYFRLFLERFRDFSDLDKNTIIQSLKDEEAKKKSDKDDDDDMRFPYPYIYKPPEPPDDFAMAPQLLIRAPLKEKNPEERISCQFCGRELTKEEEITHSCNKKP